MAFTTDQIAALEGAIADGALTVKYADKEVTYRSLDDMLRTLDLMKKSVDPSGNVEPRGRHYATYSNGLNGNC